MRVLVYPADGYIPCNVAKQLERSGHHVICWQSEGACSAESDAAWSAGLQHATAVFHVLLGHEAHARETVQQLLRTRTSNGPVTFVGISTPLTWAATAAPQQLYQQLPPGTASSTSSSSSSSSSSSDGSTIQQHPSDAANGLPAAAIAALADKDASSRRPAATALETYHAEQLILRCDRPGRLNTYIVCPGVLYGNGEDDSQLHSLFRTAWEGNEPLPLLGAGFNRIPTAHVADLAAYVEAVVQQQPKGIQYLLFADEDAVQQRELVAAVGQLLGNSKIQVRSPADCLIQAPSSPMLQLDLPFATSRLPQPAAVERCCPRGLLHHLPQVHAELLAVRNLTPLRILVRGPPTAGKTHLAARLSQQYGLLHVNTARILAELPVMDAETQKAAHAQLASKEAKISQQIMAKMAQHLLSLHPEATNQGWIMEGWPKSLQAARLFCSGPAGGDTGKASGDRGARRVTGNVGKEKKTPGNGAAPTAPGPAAAARNRRTSMAGDEPADVSLTMQNPELLPQYLIELEVPEDELIRRVKALAAAEAAAAAAAAAAASPAGKGAAPKGSKPVSAGKSSAGGGGNGSSAGDKGGAGLPASHNNEKDWARRMEAYKQLMQEDAADLAANRAAIIEAVKAANPTEAASSSPGRNRGAGAGKGHSAAASMDAAAVELPPDVKLPEHGGFVAYFADAGAKYLRISNADDETVSAAAVPVINPHIVQHEQQRPLPALPSEQQLLDWIGPPHNYEGFAGLQDGSRKGTNATGGGDGNAEAAAVAAAAAAGAAAIPGLHLPDGKGAATLPDMAEILSAAQALTAENATRDQQKLQRAAQPLVSTLIAGVMPALMAGLVKTALHRPDDPCQVIADELLKAAEEVEASYRDPYDNPVYAVQLAKVEAKAARDAARAAPAAAKAAREEAARAAAAAQAESESAAAATVANNSSYGTGSNPTAARSDQDAAAAGASRPISAVGGGKAGSAKSPAKAAAAAAGRPASSMRAR